MPIPVREGGDIMGKQRTFRITFSPNTTEKEKGAIIKVLKRDGVEGIPQYISKQEKLYELVNASNPIIECINVFWESGDFSATETARRLPEYCTVTEITGQPMIRR